MTQVLNIRRARPGEAEQLSALALRSKAHWNYDPEFLEACRKELTVTADFINSNAVYVVEEAGRAAGFYAIRTCTESDGGILEFLYVEPESIGMGYGKGLWDHAVETARKLGLSSFTLEADPNAEAFYRAMGAERIGERESPAQPGRMLPLMRYNL
ncbi:MAG TPA: GNAT family N-acetyltransferase [Oceanobacillus sp.]|nr:GNAT family N-acetyltransferase [Oceanobacillus sp.]